MFRSWRYQPPGHIRFKYGIRKRLCIAVLFFLPLALRQTIPAQSQPSVPLRRVRVSTGLFHLASSHRCHGRVSAGDADEDDDYATWSTERLVAQRGTGIRFGSAGNGTWEGNIFFSGKMGIFCFYHPTQKSKLRVLRLFFRGSEPRYKPGS